MARYKIKPGRIGNFLINTYYDIEYTVVSTYKKIEHAFVDRFLEKVDGEPNKNKKNCSH